MKFWVEQDEARRKSQWLTVVSATAFVVLSLLTAVLIEAALAVTYAEKSTVGHLAEDVGNSYSLLRFAGIAVALFLFITLLSRLAARVFVSRGVAVAESLSGALVSSQPSGFKEQRLLNIVEEMALASGVPVPPVYILKKEVSINAFAAGNNINDAVVGVTRGALEHLNRDELQAVIAHEFSHIRNGDMQLNLKFAHTLFALMCLSELGGLVLRLAKNGSKSDKSSKGGYVAFLVAAVCYIAGAIMNFGGSALQAAVNRQRELLADASSVQFTRNTALASALKKIGGLGQGSALTTGRMVKSLGHLFFCQASSSLLSTHPPLATRIRRLDPSWDGRFPVIQPLVAEKEVVREETQEAFPWLSMLPFPLGGLMPGGGLQERLGENIEQNRQKLEAWKTLHLAAREPVDAAYLVLAMLLDTDEEVKNRQLGALSRPEAGQTVRRYGQALSLVPSAMCVSFVEAALPALKTFSRGQFEQLKEAMLRFIRADGVFSYPEWIVFQLVNSQVGGQFLAGTALAPDTNTLYGAAIGLLSELALLEDSGEAAQAALDAGLTGMEIAKAPLAAKDTPQGMSAKLDSLAASPDDFKKRFLTAAQVVAEYSGKPGVEKQMFLQMAALCLGKPVAVT